MNQVRALLWDVGGVLLTNAWDHEERQQAVHRFLLDAQEFESRHKDCVAPFEEGRITLDQYLDRTVFYQQRAFSREEFRRYMFSLSSPKPQALEIARGLSGRYLMATVNNESRELNAYRISSFGLGEFFDLFVSSCFVALRKPDERIYRLALDITQCDASETCFIDDRPANIEAAARVGMKTILMKDPQQLRRDLEQLAQG